MGADQIERLLGLGVVIVVALGAVAVLLRSPRRRAPSVGEVVVGYPPDLFPVRRVARQPALQALAATQARLLAVYQRLPVSDRTAPVSDIAIWLKVFLLELRQMMDTAYRVALVTDVYGHSPHLDRLVADVKQIEAQLADDIARRLLGGDGELPNDVLNRRLEMLRQCARELAGLATTPTSAPSD